ncbi:MAG: phosphatidylserine decarboxylase [Chlamydiae bacterium]|nr:phosphatidylserine decarboxylase [Chlamydiota bacterium]
MEIRYLNRQNKKVEVERVYGKFFLNLLYGNNPISWIFSLLFLGLISRISLFSKMYGKFQKSKWSRYKIGPFIRRFQIDTTEFLDPVSSFSSFNDFFIRKLKPSARSITNGNDVAILPADGRYLVFPEVQRSDGFIVKGKKFSLEELIKNETIAHKYLHGSMVIARLAPVDYHRFHFPCNCVPGNGKAINGALFSVNPIALCKNIHILTENKRVVTQLQTKNFGPVLFIEIGATYVGSIHQTYIPEEHYAKGDEKGYFSFGGSCIILLFEPFRIQFDQDLLEASQKRMEVLGKMGESLGRALSPL